MKCNRCDGTGFLNLEQYPGPEHPCGQLVSYKPEDVLDWIIQRKRDADRLGGCSCHISPPCSWCLLQHDVQVCDCCGNGVDDWHGPPGEHYGPNDPKGPNGPYAGNGGLCQCH